MDTKYCRNCGKELPVESAFCPYCMTKLIDVKTGEEIKVKKKLVFLISVIALFVFVIAGIILILFLMPNISKNNNSQTSSISSSNTNQKVDYSKYIGLWYDKGKTKDDFADVGGSMLEIVSVKDDVVRFTFTRKSNPAYSWIARLDNVTCRVIDGVGTFSFDNDSWLNSGNGIIKFNDNEIYLETTVITKGDNALWDIGGKFYLSKAEDSIIDFESINYLGQDFDSVKNHFGEQTDDVITASDKWYVYTFDGFSVTVLIETNKIVSLNVTYLSSTNKTGLCYGNINGNSTYDDVYAKLGEPIYNFLSSGSVAYNIDGGTLSFEFDENLFVTELNITANNTH